MTELRSIIGDPAEKVASFNQLLVSVGIKKSELAVLDHIAYRIETIERYHEILVQLSQVAILKGESEVAGRPIATFELHEYLQVGGWTIPYLELPAPKEGSPYKEGIEHAEFVVVGSLEKFQQRHKELSFSTKALSKKLNPELGLKLNGVSVKFHEVSLGAIVGIESRTGLL